MLLRTAAVEDRLVLIECTKKRGTRSAVIAIVTSEDDGEITTVPVGELVENPMEAYTPPAGVVEVDTRHKLLDGKTIYTGHQMPRGAG